MMKRLWVCLTAVGMALPAGALAQVRVSSAVIFESYSFDDGLPFTKVTELSVPVGINFAMGSFGNAALSTGYALVDLDNTAGGSTDLSGVLDTEVRLGFDVVPGRLILLLTGTLPTGLTSIAESEAQVLGAIASDVIGFATGRMGSGGDLGGGFVGAIPLGRMALGFGATYKQPLEYEPFSGPDAESLQPGSEFRIRTGIEGPLGQRTYLRFAGVLAGRQKDQINSVVQNGVGNRFVGYVAVNHGIGNSSITLFLFDVFRSDPSIEGTVAGAAELPRGNLLGAGARVSFPVASNTTLTPRLEYRLSHQARSSAQTSLQRIGSSVRAGLDFRRRLTESFALVVQGSALSGTIRAGQDVGVTGYRAAIHLEVAR